MSASTAHSSQPSSLGPTALWPTMTWSSQGCRWWTAQNRRAHSPSLDRQPPSPRASGSPTAVSIMKAISSVLPGKYRYSDIFVKSRSAATRCMETIASPSASAMSMAARAMRSGLSAGLGPRVGRSTAPQSSSRALA